MSYVLKTVDFVVNLIGGGSMYASIVMLMGGEINLPFDVEIGLIPSLLVAIPFALYQLARAHSLYHKTRSEKLEKEQNFRILKYETDKIINGYTNQRIALTPDKSDFKKLSEFEAKKQQELDELLREIENKRKK